MSKSCTKSEKKFAETWTMARIPSFGLEDHAERFAAHVKQKGYDASSYFAVSGIADFAKQAGGFCTFQMDSRPAFYQCTNEPLFDDLDLEPSINKNARLFGSFIGSMHVGDNSRKRKRLVIEKVFGSKNFVEKLRPEIRRLAIEYASSVSEEEVPVEDFAVMLTAHVDSHLPGVLDLTQRPLTHYLVDPDHKEVARSFFEIASKVISNLDEGAILDVDIVDNFTRSVLIDNFESIKNAPSTNVIKGFFEEIDIAFNRENIKSMNGDILKELGTMIIASYDTTALSLGWMLAYLHDDNELLYKFRGAVRSGNNVEAFASSIVLETIRLAGSNPTALWRETNCDVTFESGNSRFLLPKGTQVWLDRKKANNNGEVFECPYGFAVQNIECIKEGRGDPLSLLARNRYEINSFSMINTKRNPRKCPGRIFSVLAQVEILVALYARFDVSVRDIDLSLAKHSAMPRPKKSGLITIANKSGV